MCIVTLVSNQLRSFILNHYIYCIDETEPLTLDKFRIRGHFTVAWFGYAARNLQLSEVLSLYGYGGRFSASKQTLWVVCMPCSAYCCLTMPTVVSRMRNEERAVVVSNHSYIVTYKAVVFSDTNLDFVYCEVITIFV